LGVPTVKKKHFLAFEGAQRGKKKDWVFGTIGSRGERIRPFGELRWRKVPRQIFSGQEDPE